MSAGREKFWVGKNVFVTGATGVIGSHLAIALNSAGADVTILKRDHDKDSLLETSGEIDKVNVAWGELEDFRALERVLVQYEIDTVFHLGAQPIVRKSKIIPRKTFESNIQGTWNLLDACRIVGYESDRLQRIVVASSDKAYGSSKKLPYTEETPLQGSFPYDVSKSCCDLISQSYYKTYHLPVAVARLGNVFGQGDLNFNRIVPGTIKSILLGEDVIIRTDGSPVREYLFVRDAADAYLSLAQQLQEKKLAGEAFNFSSGNKMTVLEIVNKIISLTGSKQKPKVLAEVKDEIAEQYISTEKAERILGWKAKTEIDAALLETIEWYKKFFKK